MLANLRLLDAPNGFEDLGIELALSFVARSRNPIDDTVLQDATLGQRHAIDHFASFGIDHSE